MPKQKYCPTYIKCGFIAIEHGGESLPQCVICMKALFYSAVKPSCFKRHFVTNHVKEKEQDESCFQRLDVENDCFKKFVKTLCPRYKIPSEKYLCTCLMPNIYSKVKKSN